MTQGLYSFGTYDASSPSDHSPSKKKKVKTRPMQPEVHIADHNVHPLHDGVAHAALAKETVVVSSKSMHVFRCMFASDEDARGFTKWEDFARAMIDAGCSAVHSGGSAVTFTNDMHHKGSVAVHRLHPDPSLPPTLLKDIGNRLHKWFGWDEHKFVER
jgi:hypothetical protein